MQRLEVSGAVRPIYGSLGVKRLIFARAIIHVDTWNHLSHTCINDSVCAKPSSPCYTLLAQNHPLQNSLLISEKYSSS